MYFSDLQRTPLKSDRQLLAAFQKSVVKIRKMLSNKKEGIKIQKIIVNALPVFKRVL
jgi:hypothetical protein